MTPGAHARPRLAPAPDDGTDAVAGSSSSSGWTPSRNIALLQRSANGANRQGRQLSAAGPRRACESDAGLFDPGKRAADGLLRIAEPGTRRIGLEIAVRTILLGEAIGALIGLRFDASAIRTVAAEKGRRR